MLSNQNPTSSKCHAAKTAFTRQRTAAKLQCKVTFLSPTMLNNQSVYTSSDMRRGEFISCYCAVACECSGRCAVNPVEMQLNHVLFIILASIVRMCFVREALLRVQAQGPVMS